MAKYISSIEAKVNAGEKLTAQDIWDSIRYTTFTAQPKCERMSAKIQRDLFGYAIFGKKSIMFGTNSRGEKFITVSRTVDYGRDYDEQDYSLEQIAKFINRKYLG